MSNPLFTMRGVKIGKHKVMFIISNTHPSGIRGWRADYLHMEQSIGYKNKWGDTAPVGVPKTNDRRKLKRIGNRRKKMLSKIKRY